MLLHLYDWRGIIPQPFRHAETEKTVDNVMIIVLNLWRDEYSSLNSL